MHITKVSLLLLEQIELGISFGFGSSINMKFYVKQYLAYHPKEQYIFVSYFLCFSCIAHLSTLYCFIKTFNKVLYSSFSCFLDLCMYVKEISTMKSCLLLSMNCHIFLWLFKNSCIRSTFQIEVNILQHIHNKTNETMHYNFESYRLGHCHQSFKHTQVW